MNHGYCKSCWWNKDSVCYMQSRGIQRELIVRVEDDSYCPDYINRKKEKQTIDGFIELINK